jgi:hypothetical protein
VTEGTIRFEGEAAEGVSDLYQTTAHRKMALRWTFDGPDVYRDELLEDTGAGFEPLAQWEHVRSGAAPALQPPPAESALRVPERLKALAPLLGSTWDAKGEAKGEWGGGAGDAFHARTSFELVPYAEAMYARTVLMNGEDEMHLLDVYLYRHTGNKTLRCLALANRAGGSVYEGEVRVLEGGGLRLDLEGHEGEVKVLYEVQLDFEKDGALHQRIWTTRGADRTLVLDSVHRPAESREDSPP